MENIETIDFYLYILLARISTSQTSCCLRVTIDVRIQDEEMSHANR